MSMQHEPNQAAEATARKIANAIVEDLDKSARLHNWPERIQVKILNVEKIEGHIAPLLEAHEVLAKAVNELRFQYCQCKSPNCRNCNLQSAISKLEAIKKELGYK